MLDATAIVRTLAIAVLAANLGASVVVLRLYHRARTAMIKAKVGHEVALTPLHVSLLAGGMIFTQGALLWAFISALVNPVVTNVSQSPTAGWEALSRSIMWLIGSCMIAAGLFVVANIQNSRRRLHFGRDSSVVIQSRDTAIARSVDDDRPSPRE